MMSYFITNDDFFIKMMNFGRISTRTSSCQVLKLNENDENNEFCMNHDELCTANDEFCITNDELFILTELARWDEHYIGINAVNIVLQTFRALRFFQVSAVLF